MSNYYGQTTLQLAKSLQIVKPAAVPIPANKTLVCTAQFSAFMPDHLDLVAYFARHSALTMKMPCSQAIHMPTDIERWWTIKGPFVHAKKKEIFEKKTYHRVLQLFNSHPDTVASWVEYVNSKLPAGVDFKVETYTWHQLDATFPTTPNREPSFDEKVRARAKQLIQQLSQQK
jgi:ribosomal protein S10